MTVAPEVKVLVVCKDVCNFCLNAFSYTLQSRGTAEIRR